MKILVVDDSKTMRMMIIRTLKKAGFDCQVVQAGDGKEALKVIEEEKPEVVLSDWNMPEMNGIKLLKTIRESGNQLAFGFITTESTNVVREQATAEGASFFVTKPFSVDSFEAELGPVLPS